MERIYITIIFLLASGFANAQVVCENLVAQVSAEKAAMLENIRKTDIEDTLKMGGRNLNPDVINRLTNRFQFETLQAILKLDLSREFLKQVTESELGLKIIDDVNNQVKSDVFVFAVKTLQKEFKNEKFIPGSFNFFKRNRIRFVQVSFRDLSPMDMIAEFYFKFSSMNEFQAEVFRAYASYYKNDLDLGGILILPGSKFGSRQVVSTDYLIDTVRTKKQLTAARMLGLVTPVGANYGPHLYYEEDLVSVIQDIENVKTGLDLKSLSERIERQLESEKPKPRHNRYERAKL